MTKSNPPHIAILGAGPIGLDAALACVESGFPFTLYERGNDIAANVRDWGHVRLFTPWEMNASPRMRRALRDGGEEEPTPGERPTGRELVERLLEPVASRPDVAPHVRTGTEVLSVGRRGMVKSDAIGSPDRSRPPFRILLTDGSGREWTEEADVVLDCTGTYAHPNPLGDGGIPAPGERVAADRIVRRIPEVESGAGEWRGRRVLLVGSGHSAQTVAGELARLAESDPRTRVHWAVRSDEPDWGAVPDDPLEERAALTRRARELAEGASPAVEVRTGVVVDSLEPNGGSTRVTLRSRFASDVVERIDVDRIVGLTGSVGDHSLYRQLQVHECYATSGPMNLSAALLGADSADCLEQTTHGAETLKNPEPDFFLVGEKSYGRNNTFLMRIGWEQVDEVFGLLDERRA